MPVITIPKTLANQGDLVIIPRTEYEEFLTFKKIIPFVKPNKKELRIIEQGKKEIKTGKFKEWSKVKNELAHLPHQSGRKAA